MPRSCVAPGCTEGYGSKKSTFSFFSAPKDPVKRRKWQAAIPRINFELKAGQALCERHFMPHDIVRKKLMRDRDGNVVQEVKFGIPRLADDAIPVLYPGFPACLKGNTALSSEPEPVTSVNGKQPPANTKTEELISLGDDQTTIESLSITAVEINTSLFGRISQDLALHQNIDPVRLPPDDESGATEPIVIDIVVPGALNFAVPEISPGLPPNPSVSPARHDHNMPGSEAGCSAFVPVSTCASDSAVIRDSGVKCPDQINQVTAVRPCGTPAEKNVENSSLSKWKDDTRDGVDNSADDCHLFSIPGSVFSNDAQLEDGESVVDQDSTPDEHVGITEPDAGDDDSSRDSIFSHYIAGASPPPEKTRTIDGIAVELLAKTLLAGYADVSVVPVSDPYYRFKLCRLCFRAGKKMTMIFGGVFTDYDLKDAIEDMIRFQVSASDDYPQGVCEHCLSKLTKFKRFREQFREAKEIFDQELRRNNKTVDEGGGLTSNKVVTGQPVVTSVDGERGVLSDREHSVPVDVPTTSRKDEHQWQVNAEGEQSDHDMSAHEDFNDDTDHSSEEDHGKTEGEDFPVHEEVEVPQVKPPRRMPSDEDKFVCRTCGAEFMYKNHWKDHVREHEKGYPFPCTYCDRRYKDLQTLNSHIITHSDYKPYECELCSKRFRRPQDLLFHKNNHFGLRQHLCADCGKAFADIAGLRRHEMMHRKKRHFICNVCHREFSTNHGLKSHMEVHQKDEMFTCQHCSKQYASRRKLLKHLNYMHGPKREFPCDVCSKVFACKENLSQHRRRHFGLPPRVRKPHVPVK